MSTHPVSLAQAETTKNLVAGIWRRNRSQVLARLDLLECTASSVADHSLTLVQLQEALSISHKLAGSLGMFGFGEGTELARVLEQQLESTTPSAQVMQIAIGQLREVLFPETPGAAGSASASN